MFEPKVILVVMDGWGYSAQKKGNAILAAKTPNFNFLWQNYPHALLEASGEPVGLPWGCLGSSEVGHACLGSGRIINQDFPRISKSIKNGEFYRNPVLTGVLNYAQKNNANLHLAGLVSAGGVHSHIEHLLALLNLVAQKHFQRPVYIQMFTDGRDAPPKSAELYVQKIEAKIRELKIPAQIASVCGRYFAMDRDSHWDRTFAAYNLLVSGKGERAFSAIEAIKNAYNKNLTDEFIPPTAILASNPKPSVWFANVFSRGLKTASAPTQPLGLIRNNDAVIFFNFRPERIRQLMETFLVPQANFKQKIQLKNVYFAGLVEYEKSLPIYVAYPPEKITNPLAKVISAAGLSQLHLAETEKYAQATYFFDGGRPTAFPNEDWLTVPSPRVATYDLAPEMSAEKIVDKLFESANKKKYDFVLINFANADMVGHTGNFPAAVKAIEAIDRELGRLAEKFPNTDIIITADHGNAETMLDKKGDIDTEHSIAPVPFILVGPSYKKIRPEKNETKSIGILADIAPTVLDLLNLQPPPEMTGYPLAKALK